MCRTQIAADRPSSDDDDDSLGIILTVAGMFGSFGSLFLFYLIRLLNDSEAVGTGAVLQRVIRGCFVVILFMSAFSSVKVGIALRQESLSEDDNDLGWIPGGPFQF